MFSRNHRICFDRTYGISETQIEAEMGSLGVHSFSIAYLSREHLKRNVC